MALIKSISGFRGTIGGKAGDNLTPLDCVKFTSAYAEWLKRQSKNSGRLNVVVGMDARVSGKMVQNIVVSTLQAMGIDVVCLGLSTTPTVELMVTEEKADGGIIITASHNPGQWNALKLLNGKGEFLSAEDGKTVLQLAADDNFTYSEADKLGRLKYVDDAIERHIGHVLALPCVDTAAIKKAGFSVIVDAVNSTGGIAIPKLLEALGLTKVKLINCEPTGIFSHNPEPLKENLGEISSLIAKGNIDMGIVTDPDVDRLAFMDENGEMFGEEYTIVAIADYILGENDGGNTVSNLSSSRALADVTKKHGGKYEASAVGEVNVVELMKNTGAVIGGEGNGGVIFPASHYGRDALVGIALFLSHLAKTGKKMSVLKKGLPQYFMSKGKVELSPETDVDAILKRLTEHYKKEKINATDGVKIDFEDSWVHMRKSNTEPVIRIYTEAKTQEAADELAREIEKLLAS